VNKVYRGGSYLLNEPNNFRRAFCIASVAAR